MQKQINKSLKLLLTILCLEGCTLWAQDICLVDTPLKAEINSGIKSCEMALWVEEKDLSPQQIQQIEALEHVIDKLHDVSFESASKFNMYFDSLFTILVALGIKKPVRFRVIFQNGDQVDNWKLNGFEVKKFFDHISPRHLGAIEEVDGY